MVPGYVFLEYPLGIVFRFSCVDRQRFAEPDGVFELAGKDLSLGFLRGEAVVVIETHFAPAHASGVFHGCQSAMATR